MFFLPAHMVKFVFLTSHVHLCSNTHFYFKHHICIYFENTHLYYKNQIYILKNKCDDYI